MIDDRAWTFLAELLNQLDSGDAATTRTVAAAIELDMEGATSLLNQLRRRDLVEIDELSPKRAADKITDRGLLITPAGLDASNDGQIRG